MLLSDTAAAAARTNSSATVRESVTAVSGRESLEYDPPDPDPRGIGRWGCASCGVGTTDAGNCTKNVVPRPSPSDSAHNRPL